MAADAEVPEGWTVESMTLVAKFFGVSVETVRKEWRARGMPGADRRYRLDLIYQWRVQRLIEQRAPLHGAAQDGAAELELQQLQIRVKRELLKLRREAGELVSRDAVRATVDQIFHRVRARLEAMPEEVSASLPPEIRIDQLSDWRQKLKLILREMEGWSP